MNSYELSRSWFDFCFDNPEKINPNHTAIYMFAVEHCNRLGWKKKIGFPSQMTMDALGIKKHQTYIKYFNDLVDWGFFILLQKSKNQYSANIIQLNAMPKNGKALDKAIITHAAKQTETNGQSTGQSNGSIYKLYNQEQINQLTNKHKEVKVFLSELENENKNINIPFVDFWNLYDHKKGDKLACEKKWNKLKDEIREKIITSLPKFISQHTEKKYQPYPATYLNQERWNDEITDNCNDVTIYVDRIVEKLKAEENER